MVLRRFFNALVVIGLVLVVACGGDASETTTQAPTLLGSNDPGPTSVPEPTESIEPTAVPLPAVEPPPPFDPTAYLNADEFAHLMEGLGPERVFPPELMDEAPELSKEAATQLWNDYLLNTRMITVSGQSVAHIGDYCGGKGSRNTGTRIYTPHSRGGAWNEGSRFAWEVVHGNFDPWNGPGINWPYFEVQPADEFMPHLSPPEPGKPIDSIGTGEIRVFDYPDCTENLPLQDFPPSALEVLQGLGFGELVRKQLPDVLRNSTTQLPEDELLAAWGDYFTGILTMDNLGGSPAVLNCDGRLGIVLNRYATVDGYGEMAFLRLEDASYRGMNHVRLIGSTPGFRQDGTPTEQETSFEFAGPDNWDDPYNPWLGFDLSDNCSLDAGVGWIRRVNEQENLGLRLDTLDAQNTLALEMAARR